MNFLFLNKGTNDILAPYIFQNDYKSLDKIRISKKDNPNYINFNLWVEENKERLSKNDKKEFYLLFLNTSHFQDKQYLLFSDTEVNKIYDFLDRKQSQDSSTKTEEHKDSLNGVEFCFDYKKYPDFFNECVLEFSPVTENMKNVEFGVNCYKLNQEKLTNVIIIHKLLKLEQIYCRLSGLDCSEEDIDFRNRFRTLIKDSTITVVLTLEVYELSVFAVSYLQLPDIDKETKYLEILNKKLKNCFDGKEATEMTIENVDEAQIQKIKFELVYNMSKGISSSFSNKEIIKNIPNLIGIPDLAFIFDWTNENPVSNPFKNEYVIIPLFLQFINFFYDANSKLGIDELQKASQSLEDKDKNFEFSKNRRTEFARILRNHYPKQSSFEKWEYKFNEEIKKVCVENKENYEKLDPCEKSVENLKNIFKYFFNHENSNEGYPDLDIQKAFYTLNIYLKFQEDLKVKIPHQISEICKNFLINFKNTIYGFYNIKNSFYSETEKEQDPEVTQLDPYYSPTAFVKLFNKNESILTPETIYRNFIIIRSQLAFGYKQLELNGIYGFWQFFIDAYVWASKYCQGLKDRHRNLVYFRNNYYPQFTTYESGSKNKCYKAKAEQIFLNKMNSAKPFENLPEIDLSTKEKQFVLKVDLGMLQADQNVLLDSVPCGDESDDYKIMKLNLPAVSEAKNVLI
jgi:hypothetical protein